MKYLKIILFAVSFLGLHTGYGAVAAAAAAPHDVETKAAAGGGKSQTWSKYLGFTPRAADIEANFEQSFSGSAQGVC